MFASCGKNVIGADIDQNLVDTLNKGELTFREDGMEELFQKAVDGNISFTAKYPEASFYIISVPTPYDKRTKKIDPSYVVKAAGGVMEVCKEGSIIVIESTVSPGTIDRYIRPAVNNRTDIRLAHAPERIIPGGMIRELRENPRIIGADDRETGETVRGEYASFCEGEIVVTDIRTAEMTKVVENTYRDINIAFANELAKICRQENLNVYEIIKTANMHPRVNILNPGPGVGGHCISVDPWFLVGDYPGLSLLIHEARKINDSMPGFVLGRVREIMDENGLTDVGRVGFYGITYKENVDDIRESPTMQLLDEMRNHMAKPPRVYDPFVNRKVAENQTFDIDSFLDGMDMIVVMVGHDEIVQNAEKLKNKVVLDTRNILKLNNTYLL
jgi:UDP-N-acetyl-D-mannosaminuronic acid dehydrogenase